MSYFLIVKVQRDNNEWILWFIPLSLVGEKNNNNNNNMAQCRHLYSVRCPSLVLQHFTFSIPKSSGTSMSNPGSEGACTPCNIDACTRLSRLSTLGSASFGGVASLPVPRCRSPPESIGGYGAPSSLNSAGPTLLSSFRAFLWISKT